MGNMKNLLKIYYIKLCNIPFFNIHQIPTPDEPQIPSSVTQHHAWFRLMDQLSWYDKKSQYCQRSYKTIKILQIILSSSIPVIALLDISYQKVIISILGVIITIFEAMQQINQYSSLWFSYRATAERLKHERFLFLEEAGPYKNISEKERLLMLSERVEELISTEHANWINEYKTLIKKEK